MARTVAYHGASFTIAFAREKSGACPGSDFFDELSMPDKAKLMAIFKIAADHGKFTNPEKFGDLGDRLYEFKCFQIRMPWAYANNERRLILITHGFIKKKNKTPKEEIDRARRIFNEDQAETPLSIVKKAKK